jgi:hypothetical protein
MVDFLPKDIEDGLTGERQAAGRGRNRLRILAGGTVLPVLRSWSGGFATAADAPRLRGRVDLYDGSRHIAHCLVVLSAEEGGERRYEFKHRTRPADGPARDFAADPGPAGYLPG